MDGSNGTTYGGTGGVELPARKDESTRRPLEPAPLPRELVLPLEGGLSARDVRPAVQSGQRVLRGQPLVQGGGALTTWTHASTSGVVRSLERHPVGHARRREALCAIVEVDGEDEAWPELEPPDPTEWDTADKLAAALARAGLGGLGGAVFPTGLKLAASWRRPMRAVVVNGAECEPYISCDDMLMRTSPRDVLAGALALLELTGAERAFVAVEDDKPQALEALQGELKRLEAEPRVAVVAVPTIYPTGGERQLIRLLTGHEVPSSAYPTDIGYLCQNVGTAAAFYRFLVSGHPLTRRITTITGAGIAQPCNLDVRLGTRIADVVAACGGYSAPVERLIMGGSMMGLALPSDAVPVMRATNCVIAATAQELRPDLDALACIRCGACSTVCPAYLLPQELHRAAERAAFDTLEDLGLFDCIECGCCDVVCPSRIPLTESFRGAKRDFVRTMDREARARWFDSRERRRREGVERWEGVHGRGEGARHEPPRYRLEALADLVDRLRSAPDRIETRDPDRYSRT